MKLKNVKHLIPLITFVIIETAASFAVQKNKPDHKSATCNPPSGLKWYYLPSSDTCYAKTSRSGNYPTIKDECMSFNTENGNSEFSSPQAQLFAPLNSAENNMIKYFTADYYWSDGWAFWEEHPHGWYWMNFENFKGEKITWFNWSPVANPETGDVIVIDNVNYPGYWTTLDYTPAMGQANIPGICQYRCSQPAEKQVCGNDPKSGTFIECENGQVCNYDHLEYGYCENCSDLGGTCGGGHFNLMVGVAECCLRCGFCSKTSKNPSNKPALIEQSPEDLKDAGCTPPSTGNLYWYYLSSSDAWFANTDKAGNWYTIKNFCASLDNSGKSQLFAPLNEAESNFVRYFGIDYYWSAGWAFWETTPHSWYWYDGNAEFTKITWFNWSPVANSELGDVIIIDNVNFPGKWDTVDYTNAQYASIPGICEYRCGNTPGKQVCGNDPKTGKFIECDDGQVCNYDHLEYGTCENCSDLGGTCKNFDLKVGVAECCMRCGFCHV